jgi:general secretion pathway protein A
VIMYLNHYELKLYPFRTNPDPEFLWLGEKHKEALSILKYGLLKRDGFLLLTGDVGTGKTTLIRYFLRLIDSSALVATIHDPDMPAIDFFNYLSEEFKLLTVFTNKAEFLIHFKKFLLKAYSEHKSIFVIIDEAQRLKHEHLEEILMDERNKAIGQRINLSYHIQQLDEIETIRYISHRLKVAGSKRGIFTVGACGEIFAISGGIPRLINSICDCALLSGFAEGSKVVDLKLINECKTDLRIPISTVKNHKNSAQYV